MDKHVYYSVVVVKKGILVEEIAVRVYLHVRILCDFKIIWGKGETRCVDLYKCLRYTKLNTGMKSMLSMYV